MTNQFRACKLTFNGKRYHVNAQRIVAEVTPDVALGMGENYRFCDSSESADVLAEVKRIRHNRNLRERDQVCRDMGLKRVRGALGGVYWE